MASTNPELDHQTGRLVAALSVAWGLLLLLAVPCLLLPGAHVVGLLLPWGLPLLPTAASLAGSGAAVRFLAVGDWGRNGTFNQSLVAFQMGVAAERVAAQFVISVGDNFYPEGIPHDGGEQFSRSFSDIYTAKALQVPWYAVLGNHDYYGNTLAQLSPRLPMRDLRWHCARSMHLTLPLCTGPLISNKRGRSRVILDSALSGPAVQSIQNDCPETLDIFMYDTTPLVYSYRHKKRHLDWRGLNVSDWAAQEQSQLQELEGWLQSSTATWKVVIGHHPVYSAGHHGNQAEMIERVDPLLKKYGVHIYMNGHDHNIQHIKLPDSPVHYLTNGGGSKSWRTLVPEGDTSGLQYYWPGQGFGVLEVSPTEFQVSFYDVFGGLLHNFSLLSGSKSAFAVGTPTS